MKKTILPVVTMILLLTGCQSQPDPTAETTATIQFDDCKNIEEYQEQTFFADFSEKTTDFIVEFVYPKHLDVSGDGDTEEIRERNYIRDICYAETKGLLVAVIFYDYQMMGGFSYIVQYDTNTEQLSPADMEPINVASESFVLSQFGKQEIDTIELTGSYAEGYLTEYTASYDYINNTVYPKEICTYPDGEDGKECETFNLPQ